MDSADSRLLSSLPCNNSELFDVSPSLKGVAVEAVVEEDVAAFVEPRLLEEASDDLEEIDEESGLSRSQKLVGMTCVILLIAIALMLSLIGGELKSPLFARYVCNSSWMSLFALWALSVYRKRRKCQQIIDQFDGTANNDQSHCLHSLTQSPPSIEHIYNHFHDEHGIEHPMESDVFVHSVTGNEENVSAELGHKSLRKMSNTATLALRHKLTRAEAVSILDTQLSAAGIWQMAKTMFPWAVLIGWLGCSCGVTWFTSLEHTDFAINNTIYQSSCAVVYLLSVFVLRTSKLTLQKSMSVGFCIGGVALISFTSKSGDSNGTTAAGLLWVTVSMLLFAALATTIEFVEPRYYRPLLVTEDALFLNSLCGVAVFATYWPLVAMGYYTGFGKVIISLPGSVEFSRIIKAAALDVMYSAVLFFGISYSNSLLICSGAILIVPVSFILDSLILAKYSPSFWAVLGVVLIVTGFPLPCA